MSESAVGRGYACDVRGLARREANWSAAERLRKGTRETPTVMRETEGGE